MWPLVQISLRLPCFYSLPWSWELYPIFVTCKYHTLSTKRNKILCKSHSVLAAMPQGSCYLHSTDGQTLAQEVNNLAQVLSPKKGLSRDSNPHLTSQTHVVCANDERKTRRFLGDRKFFYLQAVNNFHHLFKEYLKHKSEGKYLLNRRDCHQRVNKSRNNSSEPSIGDRVRHRLGGRE